MFSDMSLAAVAHLTACAMRSRFLLGCVLMTCCAWGCHVSAEGVNSLPGKTAITVRAAQLHSLRAHYNELRLYPDLVFSCSGLITSITMLGYQNSAVGPDLGLGVDLQLWQPTHYPQQPTSTPTGGGKASGEYPTPPPLPLPPFDDSCEPFHPWLEDLLDPQRPPVVRETSVGGVRRFNFIRFSPVVVTEGCVLAIRQLPLSESHISLLYQEGGGPQAYAAPSNDCLHSLNDTVSGGYDYPLITLNFTSSDGQDSSSCVHGFKTMADLDRITSSLYLGTDVQAVQSAEQRLLIPSPSFTCGGYVSSMTVGLLRGEQEDDEPCPELQVWRSEGSGHFERRASIGVCGNTLIPTADVNVYNVPMTMVRFEMGDFFGLYQPPPTTQRPPVTSLHYVVSDQTNYVTSSDISKTFLELGGFITFPLLCVTCATPLVIARVVCDSGCNGRCTEGFLDRAGLTALAALAGTVTYASEETYLFPDITFTCTERVVGWEFAARSEPLTPWNDYPPHIELWRPTGGMEYRRVDSTYSRGVAPEKTARYNVYRYRLDPPMEVEVGDVIAVHQPPREVSSISLAFLQDVGSLPHSILPPFDVTLVPAEEVGGRSLLPLIAPQIQSCNGASDCCTQTVPTATPTPTTPTTPSMGTDETEGEDFPLWFVVGGSVGCVALVLLMVAAVLLLVCLRRTRAKSGNRQRTEDNHHVNGRGYPSVIPSPTDGTDNDTTSLPSVYNAVYSNNTHIPTTHNVAYAYSMTTNVAYVATGDHSMPQHTSDDDSGSGYIVNQLVYEGSEELPQDMYDYITLHS